MKNVIYYIVCSAVLLVTIILTCSGGWLSLCGLCFGGLLYVSGDVFPNVWKSFWKSNIKILSYFGSL